METGQSLYISDHYRICVDCIDSLLTTLNIDLEEDFSLSYSSSLLKSSSLSGGA